MSKNINYPLFSAEKDDGTPLSGGLLYTYISGTTTPKATYSDSDMITAHANPNPVVLNSRGEAIIYGSDIYKFILTDSEGAIIWTQDEIDFGSVSGIGVETTSDIIGVVGYGALLYMGADGNYAKASNASVNTMPVIAMALTTTTDPVAAQSATVLFNGIAIDETWSWTTGSILYCGTNGSILSAAPSSSGNQVQVVGVALSATTIRFDPDYTIVEVE